MKKDSILKFIGEFVLYFIIVMVLEFLASKSGLTESFDIGTVFAISIGWLIAKIIFMVIEKRSHNES